MQRPRDKTRAETAPAKIMPRPDDAGLTSDARGIDEAGRQVAMRVVRERAMTIYLNGQEIVTAMGLGDHAACLGVGFLLNQNMLRRDDTITAIDVDDDLGVIVVRTDGETDFETKMKKKILTSGCAQGTIYGDMMEGFDAVRLNPDARINVSGMLQMIATINTTPSLYLAAGAIHGCVLARGDNAEPLVYMEDVGRHNAVDKIAGWMHLNNVAGADKIFYTTGRLTSEMVIKTVQMEIPVLISRSGFTESGVALARRAGLTMIGRARGKRFIALAGEARIVFDNKNGDDNDN